MEKNKTYFHSDDLKVPFCDTQIIVSDLKFMFKSY